MFWLKTVSLLLFVAGLNFSVPAQDYALVCPEFVRPGETFSVDIVPKPPIDVAYNWTVKNARVTGGQPPFTVVPGVSGENGPTVFEIVVQVNNELSRMARTSSCVVKVGQKIEPRLIDEIERASDGDLKARFDALRIELRRNPGAQAYIINSGTNAVILQRERMIQKSLRFLRIDSPRITVVRNPSGSIIQTQIWLVPDGAEKPQIGVTTLREPRLSTSFAKLDSAELTGRLDAFMAEMNNSPLKNGYILFYRDRRLPGRAARQAEGILAYLKFKNFDTKRVRVLDGGVRGADSTHLYVIEPYGALPRLAGDAKDFAPPPARLKFDEYDIYFPDPLALRAPDYSGAFEPAQRLRAFGEMIWINSPLRGQIVYFRQPGDDPAKVLRAAENEKAYLVKEFRIEADRIALVDGGRSAQRKFELWLRPGPGRRAR